MKWVWLYTRCSVIGDIGYISDIRTMSQNSMGCYNSRINLQRVYDDLKKWNFIDLI